MARLPLTLCCLVVFCAGPAVADDPTLREFPGQPTPSPEQLVRLLSQLQLQRLDALGDGPLKEQIARRLREGRPADLPSSPETMQRWAEDFLSDLGVPVDAEARAAITDWIRGQQPSRLPDLPSLPDRRPATRPTPGRGHDLSSAPPAPQPAPTPRRGDHGGTSPGVRMDVSEFLRRDGTVDPAAMERFRELLSQQRDAPRETQSVPTPPPPSTDPRGNGPPSPPLNDRAAQPPESRRKPAVPRTHFGSRMNQILMEAARRAAREPAAGGRSGGADSSFLNALVVRAHELMAERGTNWDRLVSGSDRRRRGRRGGSSSESRFDWNVPLPGVSTAGPSAMAGIGGDFGLLWVPAGLLLAVLALVAGKRLRPSLVRWLGAVSPSAAFVLRPVRTGDDLVRAVDRFVVGRFGRAASWWHCRAVERALIELRPDLQPQIARLMADYQLLRYGVPTVSLAGLQLEPSARTLRLLAETPLPDEQPAPAFSAA